MSPCADDGMWQILVQFKCSAATHCYRQRSRACGTFSKQDLVKGKGVFNLWLWKTEPYPDFNLPLLASLLQALSGQATSFLEGMAAELHLRFSLGASPVSIVGLGHRYGGFWWAPLQLI